MALDAKDSGISKDTQAMLKLDTLTNEEPEYAHKVGGGAYAAEEHSSTRVSKIYERTIAEEDENRMANERMTLKIIICVVLCTAIIGALVAMYMTTIS